MLDDFLIAIASLIGLLVYSTVAVAITRQLRVYIQDKDYVYDKGWWIPCWIGIPWVVSFFVLGIFMGIRFICKGPLKWGTYIQENLNRKGGNNA